MDRDNEGYFPPIRDGLVARGIAVASFDKRDVGGSGATGATRVPPNRSQTRTAVALEYWAACGSCTRPRIASSGTARVAGSCSRSQRQTPRSRSRSRTRSRRVDDPTHAGAVRARTPSATRVVSRRRTSARRCGATTSSSRWTSAGLVRGGAGRRDAAGPRRDVVVPSDDTARWFVMVRPALTTTLDPGPGAAGVTAAGAVRRGSDLVVPVAESAAICHGRPQPGVAAPSTSSSSKRPTGTATRSKIRWSAREWDSRFRADGRRRDPSRTGGRRRGRGGLSRDRARGARARTHARRRPSSAADRPGCGRPRAHRIRGSSRRSPPACR